MYWTTYTWNIIVTIFIWFTYLFFYTCHYTDSECTVSSTSLFVCLFIFLFKKSVFFFSFLCSSLLSFDSVSFCFNHHFFIKNLFKVLSIGRQSMGVYPNRPLHISSFTQPLFIFMQPNSRIKFLKYHMNVTSSVGSFWMDDIENRLVFCVFSTKLMSF